MHPIGLEQPFLIPAVKFLLKVKQRRTGMRGDAAHDVIVSVMQRSESGGLGREGLPGKILSAALRQVFGLSREDCCRAHVACGDYELLEIVLELLGVYPHGAGSKLIIAR